MKKQHGSTLVYALLAVIWMAAIGGWVANIVKLAGSDFAAMTGMLVLRVIGVVLAPLGAVMGLI